jgi:F-type H+-transporting ATPase subunit delta
MGEALLEPLSAELLLVAEVLERAPQMVRFLDDPSVDPEEKRKAVAALEKGTRASDLTRRFLGVLIEHRRLAALSSIAQAFAAIKDENLGIVPAETTTAIALSTAQQKKLRDSLEKLTGRTVRLSLRVDPAVLGGARTRIGSRVYDGTVRRRLQILRSRLADAR